VTLLEEPQAALYAWIAAHREDWREHLVVGDVILVIDVGGGTTDFSAIAVREQEGAVELGGSRSATTSCSGATTWIWRWRTSSARSSPRRAVSSIAGSSRPSRTPAAAPRSSS
jgi:hypothetical protein